MAFADILAEGLGRVTPLVHGPRRFADFAVLKSPETPSVLIELGFLSNRQDARNLESRAHRAKLARAIVNAINRHFAAP
jgi:N-acetylmuramoyl-L-alanine amidase